MEKTQTDRINYRLGLAQEYLEAAKLTFNNNRYSQTNSLAYFAMFQAVRSLLVTDGFESREHTEIIAFFKRNYIESGKIEEDFFKALTAAFNLSDEGDCEDFHVATHEEAQEQLENARIFLTRVKTYYRTVVKLNLKNGNVKSVMKKT